MILTILKIFGQFIPQGGIGDVLIVNNEHNDFSLLILYRCKQHTTEETATCEKKIIIILNWDPNAFTYNNYQNYLW